MRGLLHPIFIATCGALLVANAIRASQASSLYDGTWSLVIQTTQGNCPASIRAGVRILAGRVLPTNQDYSVDGQVSPTGAIRVNVSAAGQGAGGFGLLSRNTGQGLWRTRSGECSGQWTAERREVHDESTDELAVPKTQRPHRGYSGDAYW